MLLFLTLKGKRPTMEDDWAICGNYGGKENSLFLIFDGHAAQEIATLSAHFFPTFLANGLGFKWENSPGYEKVAPFLKESEGKEFLTKKDQKEILQVLKETFGVVNQVILENFQKKMRNKHCGATALSILIVEDKLYVGNLGDARATIVYPNKEGGGFSFQRLSFDHKPYDPEEAERIRLLGGFIENKRINGTLAVSRCVGDYYLTPFVSSDPYVDFFDLGFLKDQRFCVAMGCDGVWDELSDHNVAKFLFDSPIFSQKEKLSQVQVDKVADQLRYLAYCCGSDDNITVQLVVFN